jgi:hypothetical protein
VAILVWRVTVIGFGWVSGAAHGRAGLLLWAALGFLAVGGASDMVSSAFGSTILQQAASDDLRGRLQGVFVVVVGGGPRLADAAHCAAAAIVGTSAAVVWGGVLVIAGVLFAALAAPAFGRYHAPGQPERAPRDAGSSLSGGACAANPPPRSAPRRQRLPSPYIRILVGPASAETAKGFPWPQPKTPPLCNTRVVR